MFAFLALVLSSCRADTSVDVLVNEDGSGSVAIEVALDQEAASGILDLQGEVGLWLEDVSASGWDVSPPAQGDDGYTRVGATKVFGNPAQLNDIMGELSGDAGVFADFGLERTKEFARVRYVLRGTLHPSGIEAFADDALVTSLGRSLEELLVDYGGEGSAFNVRLRVELPGHLDETVVATGQEVLRIDEVARTWQIEIADTTDTSVVVASTTTGVAALVWRGVAVVTGVVALLVALGHLLRVLRPAGRRGRGSKSKKSKPSAKGPAKPSAKGPAKLKTADSVGAPESAEAAGSVVEESTVSGPTVVALDGMGVLYREGSDIAELLLPFAREMGSTVSDEAIAAKARQMSLGRIAPVDLWKALGIEGDSNELDDLYLARHQLNPGVVKFLRELRERGIRVACITNDSAAWASKLNARHSLGGLIDPWVVSGAVGVRKPDAPIYEVLRRVTGEPANLILVVDDQLDNLDAARDLGFRTAWFAPAGDAAGARGHAILRSFSLEADGPATAAT